MILMLSNIPSSHSYYNTTSFPSSAFPPALCGSRVVFFVLKQFSSELETYAGVILTLLIKLIDWRR
jgi:hypothetical protein